MSNEIQNKLTEYADQLVAGLRDGMETLSVQAQEVATQWVAWTFCEAVLWGISQVLLATGLAVAVWRLAKAMPAVCDEGDTECPSSSFVWGAGSILVAMLLALAIDNAALAVKCKVAPKVVLLEKVAELVGGKK